MLVAVSATATGQCYKRPHIAYRFCEVADPVGAGFVGSLARPGGNGTGFTSFDYDVVGKWLPFLSRSYRH